MNEDMMLVHKILRNDDFSKCYDENKQWKSCEHREHSLNLLGSVWAGYVPGFGMHQAYLEG